MALFSIDNWIDKEDMHSYDKGNAYPFDLREIDSERIEYLKSDKTPLNKPVLLEINGKLTKKELLSAAETLNIEVDEKDTKNKILEAFENHASR
ncbi:hypothetical protein [Staphylococcus sp. IVB6227]|uniref:hypothetical protein n=1 Tax=Staphylococcus sp. IVB6227 TaxID=2989768 RepID=UPI0021D17371|nr:hypothetical protein [Staphylococcus sp. IVB6227]UXR79050.1 hypothetical protein MUA92_03940 [Staphylococcus sp. IVB6227]